MVEATKQVEEAKRKIAKAKEEVDPRVVTETINDLVYQTAEEVENERNTNNLEAKKETLEVEEKIKVEEERIQEESKKVQVGIKEIIENVEKEHPDPLKIL